MKALPPRDPALAQAEAGPSSVAAAKVTGAKPKQSVNAAAQVDVPLPAGAVPSQRKLTGLPADLGAYAGRVTKTVFAAVTGASLVLSGCTTVPLDGVAANDSNFRGSVSDMGVARGVRELPGGVRVSLAPRHASPQQKAAHYLAIMQAAGGQWRPGERAVLALRGVSPETGSIHRTTANSAMIDTIVVLSHDAQGRPMAHELAGSTYPGQRSLSGSKGVDADRDGKKDVGMVAEGSFRARPNGAYNGGPSYHITTPGGGGRLPGIRDTNQDGLHSAEEWAASKQRGDTLSEILFHPGTNGRVSSIGCFNVQDYDAFVAALGGGGASFNVTLVNAAGPEAR